MVRVSAQIGDHPVEGHETNDVFLHTGFVMRFVKSKNLSPHWLNAMMIHPALILKSPVQVKK